MSQRKSGLARGVLAGIFVALALYSYPPLRAQGALVLPIFAAFAIYDSKTARFRVGLAALVASILVLPLAYLTLTGGIQGRFNALAIWNEDFLVDRGGFSISLVATIFAENLGVHFSPSFLFTAGDENLRHSTQAAGQWGWLEMLALGLAPVIALFGRLVRGRREKLILAALVFSYVAGILPAALTWESNPHALRSIGAIPFLALLAGFVLARAIEAWPFVRLAVVAFALFFAGFYFWDFFDRYPERAWHWFDTAAVVNTSLDPKTGTPSTEPVSIIEKIRSSYPDYPDLAIKYYELRAGATNCGL